MAFPLLQRFKRYFSIGVLNTALHWCVFFALHYGVSVSQAGANLAAFLVAVTFSFLMNARYTFKARATTGRYAWFISFMALLSLLTGYLADQMQLMPLLTMIAFSALSLLVGFVYTNYFVFRSGS